MSESTEGMVLGCLMLYGTEAAVILNKCKSEYFSTEVHQRVFDAIQGNMSNAKGVDVVSINAAAKLNELSYLMKLTDSCSDISTTLHYIPLIKERMVASRLRLIANSIYSQLDDETPDNVLAWLQAEILDLTEHEESGVISIKDSTKKVIEDLRARFETDEMSGVKSGISILDFESDGLQPQELFVLSGNPGSGKTTLAMRMMLSAAKDKPVLFFSQEMNEKQLIQRMIANLGRIEMNKLKRATLENSDWVSIMTAAKDIIKYSDNFIIDYSPSITPAYIRMKANEVKMKHGGLGMVCVDYFGLMDTGKMNQLEGSTYNAKALNILKKELNTNMLVLAQLNKDVQKSGKRPVTGDLDWGQQLAKDADGTFFLYTNEKLKEDQVVHFYSDKTRSMSPIDLHFNARLQFNRLEDRIEPYSEPEEEGFKGY
jgi:replicative DNA helicase